MLDTPNKTGGGDLADLTVPAYGRLLAHKVILPSASSAYFAVSQDFFFTYFMPVLSRIDVDDDWYFTKYPDVQEAVQNGVLRDARHHYARYGFYEHRLPYRIEVDEAWYLETYSDVKTAVEMEDWTSAQAHFEAFGFGEGRLPYPNFTLRKAVVGGAVTVPQASNLPPPAPDMAIPPPPSDLRTSRHAAVGQSLLVQPGTDNKARLSSRTVARRVAWLARAAAMIILAFGLSIGIWTCW
jgi:hypothetical protein